MHEALNDGLRSDDLEFEKYKFKRTIIDFEEKLKNLSKDLNQENHEFISGADFLSQLDHTFKEYEKLCLDTFIIYEKREIKSSLIYYSNSSAVYYRLNFMVSELKSVGTKALEVSLNRHQKIINSEYQSIRIMLVILIFFFLITLVYFTFLSNNLIRSRAELARQSKLYEDFYKVIYEHSIVTKTNLKGLITFANEKFERISGFRKDEILGKSHNILNSSFHSKDFFKEIWTTISSGEIWRGQIKNKNKNGTYYWVDSTISPIRDDEGNIVEYMAIRNEITLQKNYEEDLKFKNSYYEELLQNMSDGMVVQVENGDILLSNKKASEILSTPTDVLLNKGSYDKEWKAFSVDGKPLSGDDHPAMVVFKTKKIVSKFIMGLRFNHHIKWLEITSTPLFSDETKEKVMYSVTLFRDITEEKFNKDLEFSINVLKSLYLEHKFTNIIFYREILEEVVRNTKSKFAFLGKVEQLLDTDNELKIIAIDHFKWSKNEKDNFNANLINAKLSFDSSSLFLAPVATKKPFFINDAIKLSTHLDSSFLPNEFNNFLAWPLFDGDNISGILVIANTDDFFDDYFLERYSKYLNQVGDLYSRALKDEQQFIYNNKLQLLVSNSGSSFVKIDYQNNEIEVDDSFLTQLSLKTFESPKKFDEFQARIYPAELSSFNERFHIALENDLSGFEYKYHLQNGVGDWIPFILKGKFLKTEEKTIFIGTQLELSHIEKLEKDLSQQKSIALHNQKLAAIGELAAGVGHEINNPLTIIQGLIQKLRKNHFQHEPNEADNKIFENINSSIFRIKSIVTGLRNFSRSDDFSLVEVDLNLCIKDILNLIDNIYKNDNLILRYTCDEKFPIILGESGKLQQVVLNLLNNARDAYKDISDGRDRLIDLSLKRMNDHYQLVLKDYATGIDSTHLSRIFEAFYTTKEIGEGTGLGLFIINGIIKEMNGEINVTSEVGKGTSFIISLPVFKDVQSEVVNKSESAGNLEMNNKSIKVWDSKRILIVDDEPLLREILKDICEEHGAIVEEAENGLVAIEKTRTMDFDALVTDMKMPAMGGEELIRQLFQEGKFKMKKLMIMTGGTNTDIEKLVVDFGIFGIIKKPYNDEEIIKTITAILKQS